MPMASVISWRRADSSFLSWEPQAVWSTLKGMQRFSARLTIVFDRCFLALPLGKLRRILAVHFGVPVALRVLDGRGAASVFRVDGPEGDAIAVVKLINWRREKRSRRINDPSPHFIFFPGRERLAREFEILGKLAPHDLTPHPLLLDEKFAVHEYCDGSLLLDRTHREPQEAFEAGWKALQRMHTLGVHHGDPGPHNIIDSTQGLRFIDFEHSLNDEVYGFDHMLAFDYLRYCYRSWCLSDRLLDESIFRKYLIEGEGEMSGPILEAISNLIVSFPFDRSFLALLGGPA